MLYVQAMTWMLSTSEDDWTNCEDHTMRDEALACVADFCNENDVESCFIGRATRLTFHGLLTVEAIQSLVETMEEQAYDQASAWDPVMEIDETQKEQLRFVVAHWMTQNLRPIAWYLVEEIEEVKP